MPSTPFTENDGHEVELDFVEDACRQCGRGDADAVDENVAVARRLFGARDRLAHVVQDRDQRPLFDVGRRAGPGEDEDRHAVVMVAVPPARRFDRAAARDHRAGRPDLVHRLSVDVVGPAGHATLPGLGSFAEPFMQP
jgi:hypothetical protein